MRVETVKIYNINELSEEARQYAIEKYRENNDEVLWKSEILASLEGLFRFVNGVNLTDYSLGQSRSWILISSSVALSEISGKRAIAWIENNLLSNIRISQNSLSVNGERRKLSEYGRYYRAGMIKPCPFTGYCTDDDFLNSLLNDIKAGADLQTAFEGLAWVYQKILNDEIEDQNSEEYIIEHFDVNNYEFKGNGEIY